MERSKSSTLDKIKELNPGGISDNMMIARLSRILSETKLQENSLTSDSPKDPNQQQQAREELGQLLARGNVSESREAIKQKYLEQYLAKFGLESHKPQQSQDNQRTIAQLERFKELKSQLTPNSKQNATSFVRDTFNRTVASFNNQIQQTQDREQEKQPFIRVVLDAVITKGKNLGNQIRSLNSDRYTTTLSVKDAKQILNIDRNQPQPDQQNPAFKAQKEGLQDFKVLQNNLSDQELQDIVADTQESTQEPQLTPPPQLIAQQKRKDKGLELD